MLPFRADQLLDFWEQYLDQPLVRTGIGLLALAEPGTDADTLAGLSISERDEKLLALRTRIFGPGLRSIADCPECSQKVEWENDTGDIFSSVEKPPWPEQEHICEKDGYRICYRLPDSNDLSAATGPDVVDVPEDDFLRELILSCTFDGQDCSPGEIPLPVLEALGLCIEKESPFADIRMELKCANCGHQWEVQFDILSYLWQEIRSWAEHTLSETASLALSYGWSEKEILGMSPARRQLYLEMATP